MPTVGVRFPETEALVGRGVTVTSWQPCVPVPQVFIGVAHTLPELLPTVTVMVLVVLDPVQPVGNDQLYEVAPVDDAV